MLHLVIYNVKVKLRNFGMTFWPLAFPLLLGTLFFFAFGNINDADFETVPVAVVKEEHADQVFLAFLDQIKNGEDQLLAPEEMTEEQAKEKLEDKKVSGIYYVGSEPTLTVAASGIEESILQSVLQSYENTRSTVRNIIKIHPKEIIDGLKAMIKQQAGVQELSLGGRTIDGNVQFFCIDCYGLPVWMLYRIWCCYQSAGKSDSTGCTQMCNTDTQIKADPF